MNTGKLIGSLAAVAMLGWGASATAATVYCPNGNGGALNPPSSGRYVQVTNAANPGACYYTDGNLDTGNPSVYELAGYTLLDKNGDPGTMLLNPPSGGTSGTWTLAAGIWNTYGDLHLGFHFGNGSGSPDSFIVQLESGQLSGTWSLNAIAPDALNGLSNIYLFTKGSPPSSSSSSSSSSSGEPTTSSTSGTTVPEPASSLVLLGLGLLGIGFMRRRAHNV